MNIFLLLYIIGHKYFPACNFKVYHFLFS